VGITSPTTGERYETKGTQVDLFGSAADDTGVTRVEWRSDRGGAGTASGTVSWSIYGIALQEGENRITVTAQDDAGNRSSDTLIVEQVIPDILPPTVAIASPTAAGSWTSESAILDLSGSASDNKVVDRVEWQNNRGGSGTAAGSTSWVVSGVPLYEGENVVTVTAHDAEGNMDTDTLTVTFVAPDTTPPLVTFSGDAAGGSITTDSPAVTVSGRASDDGGVTRVEWESSSGAGGTASGTASWSISGLALDEGANVITVTAFDEAGNSGSGNLTVNRVPAEAVPPAVAITEPAAGGTFDTTTAAITLAGTAIDNTGLSMVVWTNLRGGGGIATGTANWRAEGVGLMPGANTIVVIAYDTAGNGTGTTLTVNYEEPVAGTAPLSITDLIVASGKAYEVVPAFGTGALCSIDRTYVYSGVPGYLDGSPYIKNAHEDMKFETETLLSFEVNRDVTVYIAWHRNTPAASWLWDFTFTGDSIYHSAGNLEMRLFSKDFSAGTIALGSNEGAGRMYSVIVVPR
jgi:hypothetical protein